MKRAAYYVRVSTDKQADEKTSETQVYEVKKAIEADKNLLVSECEYIDEGWSGAIIERPALDRLRQDAKANKFDILYVYDRGRLARKFVYQEIVIEELSNSGITFKSLHDVNGSTPEEQLMGGVMGIFHEYERVKIAERFRLAKLNKVRDGKLLGYNAPYGYTYIPIKGSGSAKTNGHFEINQEEAKVVKMVFEWVGEECISLREVIKRLYDLGIRPRKQVRDAWTKGPIARMLRNETYIGKHHYYKSESCLPKDPSRNINKKYRHRHTVKTSRTARPKDEWLEIKVSPIIDESLFLKAQKQLELNIKFSQRSKKNQYLFGGLVWCSCGSKRVGEGVNGKTYYRCTDRLHRFPLPAICHEGGVNVAVMDNAAWQEIARLLTQPELIMQQMKRYIKTATETAPAPIENTERLKKAIDDEERRYVKAYGQGLISENIYREQVQSITKRRNALTEAENAPQQDNLAQKLSTVNPAKLTEAFTDFITNLQYEDKLFTVRRIVDKIVATKKEVTICGFIPVLEMAPAGMVGLRASDRNRRLTKCRQVYPVQRPD